MLTLQRLLCGVSDHKIHKHQCVLNSVDHIAIVHALSTTFSELVHWLPIQCHLNFIVAVPALKSSNLSQPLFYSLALGQLVRLLVLFPTT